MFFLNIFQTSGFSNFPGDLSSMSVSWIFYLNIGGGFRSLSNFVRETKSVLHIIFLSTLFSQRDIRSFLSVQLFRILGSTRPLDPSVEFVLRSLVPPFQMQGVKYVHFCHVIIILIMWQSSSSSSCSSSSSSCSSQKPSSADISESAIIDPLVSKRPEKI